LVDDNNVDVHVSLSRSEAPNDDLNDISKDESLSEDFEIGCFEKHTKEIGSKLMNKMGFEGNGLRKNGQGIQKAIQICGRQRNESLGYEGQTSNATIQFVKEETLKVMDGRLPGLAKFVSIFPIEVIGMFFYLYGFTNNPGRVKRG